ncbi:hypothetical protein [Tahibacter amnicola]|uniref:Uncharacterized protein n=1 Tax=Tahibacter amnicola TaxID=2976241 RepID=A0ABY6BFI4_9GAMM|nr:hypothetical protein [Tahibacter amnicola]UXI68529.1 hypothetical protein N4264_02420 [Tahibacter amnicola]
MTPFPQTRIAPQATPGFTLVDRVSGCWFAAGLCLWLALPSARAYSPVFGWVGYWLVGAPLVTLLAAHRHRLLASARAFLVRSFARRSSDVAGEGTPFDRRQGWRHVMVRHRQARRLPVRRPRRTARIRVLVTALLQRL